MQSGAFVNCYGTDGSVTTCSRVGDSMVNCNRMNGTTLQTPAYDGGTSAAANIVKLFRGDPKRKATKLLAKGDCDGALSAALSSGDMDFARQVRDYCRAQ